jgi:hypothetical protein
VERSERSCFALDDLVGLESQPDLAFDDLRDLG